MAVKYDFRILLKTTQGREFSYYSASFFNSEVDTNFALSSSQVFNRITGSTSCSYHNDFKFPSTGTYKTNRFFADNIFLSASLVGGPDTGSIKFIYKGNRKQAPLGGVGPKVKDRLERFKFFGTKVCNVLNLHENFWYRPEDFKITQKGNNFYRGTVEATELVVTNNFEVSNLGAISSDLPFNIIPSGSAGETSRYIKFTNVSGSDTGTTPNLDLKLGYDNELNSYVLSASNNVNFKIDGVTSLNVTNFTSSYITSSVQQLFTEITSSGNSLFGDVRTDHHKFDGNVAIRGRAGSQLSHSVDGLSVDGDISSTGDISASGEFITDSNISASKGAIKDILYIGDFSTSSPQVYFQGAPGGIASPQNSATIGYHQDDGNFQIMNTTNYQGPSEKSNINIKTHHYDNAIYIDNSKEIVYLNKDDKGLAVSSSGEVGIGKNPVGGMELTVVGDISASGDVEGATLTGLLQTGLPSSIQSGITQLGTITEDIVIDGANLQWVGSGDIITTVSALDWDLIDDNSSALSYDASGKTGLLEFDTTNGSEKVKMSGDLDVAGALTLTGTLNANGMISSSIISSSAIHLRDDDSKITFKTSDTYIYGSAGMSAAESLYLGADANIKLQPDGDLKIAIGVTDYATFDGSERSFDIVGSGSFTENVIIGGNTPPTGDTLLEVVGNISSSGEVSANTIVVGSTITHIGDSNTKIEFDDDGDDINLTVAGKTAIDITWDGNGGGDTREITFNEGHADFDVRIEGDEDTNLFFTNAGTDRVGIGTNSPTEKLEVIGSASIAGHITASGNISASGNVIGNQLRGDSLNINQVAGSGTIVQIFGDSGNSQFQLNTNYGILIGGTTTLHPSADPKNVSFHGNIATAGHITASGNISASGGTFTGNFPDTNDNALHYPIVSTGANGTLESQDSLKVNPSSGEVQVASIGGGVGQFEHIYFGTDIIQVGATGLGAGKFRVDGHSSEAALFVTSSQKVGINTATPTKALQVTGDISASGDLIIGNLNSNTYVSASNGNIEMSGSGVATLNVEGGNISATSASINYITASKIDVDDDTIRIGGEPINKTLVTNLKRSFSSTSVRGNNARSVPTNIVENAMSSSGATIYHVHTFVDGDTTPSVKNGTLFKTANTSNTVIEGFDDGVTGQHVMVIINDSNTDFSDETNFNMFRGGDWNTAAQNDTIQFICVDGTKWVQLGYRGDNT